MLFKKEQPHSDIFSLPKWQILDKVTIKLYSKSEILTTLGAGEDLEQQELTFIAGGDCKMEQPPWKTVCQFLTKLNMLLPHDPEVKLLDIYPKEWKT